MRQRLSSRFQPFRPSQRALRLFAVAAAISLCTPAGASLDPHSPELVTEEQRTIGMALPVEHAVRFPLEPDQRQPTSLRSLRSNAKLFVVHLWATWCDSCREELIHLKKIFPDGSFREAQLVLVAVQNPASELRAFLQQNSRIMPRTEHYVDDSGALQGALKLSKLPITLLVDRQWIVRQAFYSSITNRRGELMASIERYLAPPPLTATVGGYLKCASPPCIEPSFFLHRSLLLANTHRWHFRRQMLLPSIVDLPVSAKPNLIYLFTPTCTDCLADLAEIQKVAQGWRKARGSPTAFVMLLVSADLTSAKSLLEQHPELKNMFIVHSSMPKLVELMQTEGGAVTLIMNRQGYVRNAFVGPFTSYKVVATDALYAAAQGR